MKRFIFSIAILGVLSAPAFVYAATLSFTADQTTVGIGDSFEVVVILNTENEVNAVEATLVIPPGLELVRTSNGNSVISFWIEQPNYNKETRTLLFSGIIPGGFSGTGQLLRITLTARDTGSSALVFDRTHTTVYRNSPDGTPESTVLRTLTLSAEKGAMPALAPPADTEPPEAFTPVVTHDPQLYDGAWTLVFATQDKGSGIAQYEVSESPVRRTDPNTLSWTKAESPYQLTDQTPARYIYVRAIDEQGNIRTELYTQMRPFSWLDGLELVILIVALVLFIFWRWAKKQLHASS